MIRPSLLAYALVAAAVVLPQAVNAAPLRGDTNKDGSLQYSEFLTRATRGMMRFDANKDNKLSLEEWKTRMAKSKGDPARQFAHLDKNKDGQLDATELEPIIQSRFKRMDANNDGSVTQAESDASHAALKKANAAK